VRWRQGTLVTLRSRFSALRLRPAPRDYESSQPRPQEWLLIEWPKAIPNRLSTGIDSAADTPLADLVRLAKQRWIIERDYEELKQELGLGHMKDEAGAAFHHHATLCMRPMVPGGRTEPFFSLRSRRSSGLTRRRMPLKFRPRGSPSTRGAA